MRCPGVRDCSGNPFAGTLFDYDRERSVAGKRVERKARPDALKQKTE